MSCGYTRIKRPLSSSRSHPSVRSSTSVPRSVSPLLISITTDAGGSGTSMRGSQGHVQVNHHPISNTGLVSSTVVLPLDRPPAVSRSQLLQANCGDRRKPRTIPANRPGQLSRERRVSPAHSGGCSRHPNLPRPPRQISYQLKSGK